MAAPTGLALALGRPPMLLLCAPHFVARSAHPSGPFERAELTLDGEDAIGVERFEPAPKLVRDGPQGEVSRPLLLDLHPTSKPGDRTRSLMASASS